MRIDPNLRHAVAVLLLCLSGAASALQTDDFDDEAVSALMGELVFHADLMNSLDALCPRGDAARDWHTALPALPPEATTPDLLELSEQLAAATGRRLLHENGGCTSPAFAQAYAESRQTFGELIVRWRKL
jgi:hypothetical protein